MKSVLSFFNNLFGAKEEETIVLYQKDNTEEEKQVSDNKSDLVKEEEKLEEEKVVKQEQKLVEEVVEEEKWLYTSFNDEKDLDENYIPTPTPSDKNTLDKKKLEELFDPIKLQIISDLIDEEEQRNKTPEYEEDSEDSF